MARVRELVESQAPLDREYLRDAAPLGWYSALVGGTHAHPPVEARGVTEAALVAECRGAGLQPGPVIPMTLAAMSLVSAGSAHCRQVGASVARGATTATWAWADGHGQWGGPPTHATRIGREWSINGVSELVQDGHQVEWLIVRAGTETGERSFLVRRSAPGIEATRLEAFDLTRAWARVRCHDVRVGDDALIDGPHASVDDLRTLAATLTVAESIGAMDQLLAEAVRYAKSRVAFGRPIGSFQAIKHLLADASVALETSKAMAAAAVHAVDHAAADADQIAAMAKAFVGDASRDLADACWQTYGGIAYTWAHDFHLYLRRLTSDASLYGDPAFHRSYLCRLNGLVNT